MERPAKVATPLTAFTESVPPSVPPPGLLPMAMVTAPWNCAATLLFSSSTDTTGCVESGLHTLVPHGCVLNVSVAGA